MGVYSHRGGIATVEVGAFAGLSFIHAYLFEGIYGFTGEICEMNIACPFHEGNGRATRIWLDLILKKEIKEVVDWSLVDKEDSLSAMQRSAVKGIEIKCLLKRSNQWPHPVYAGC